MTERTAYGVFLSPASFGKIKTAAHVMTGPLDVLGVMIAEDPTLPDDEMLVAYSREQWLEHLKAIRADDSASV